MEFHVEDMTCGGCARGVTRAIQAIDANAKVITEPPNRSVKLKQLQHSSKSLRL